MLHSVRKYFLSLSPFLNVIFFFFTVKNVPANLALMKAAVPLDLAFVVSVSIWDMLVVQMNFQNARNLYDIPYIAIYACHLKGNRQCPITNLYHFG